MKKKKTINKFKREGGRAGGGGLGWAFVRNLRTLVVYLGRYLKMCTEKLIN
jgi:hypothetical protein